MILQLKELPDVKLLHSHFTVGKSYVVFGSVGNGYLVSSDKPNPKEPELKYLIRKDRFS